LRYVVTMSSKAVGARMPHLSRVLVSYFLAAFLCALALTASASAAIVVDINRAAQRMAVTVDGTPRYNWRVSTARRGYVTPPGTYQPEMLARHWFSRKYYNSPMPHSIFFYGGFAIHGSYEISHLGRPASHGCVRLDPGNAAILFGLVQREGMDATTIVIH
jgi:lipoprotein-anchoring transpeptidase ErfK/SrfK